MKITNCLIIEWIKLPQDLKDLVSDWHNFSNDALIEYPTEFSIKDFAQGMSAVTDYWNDQKQTNDFKGDINKFIKEYGLGLDVWLMKKKNIDWSKVDKILIDVSW